MKRSGFRFLLAITIIGSIIGMSDVTNRLGGVELSETDYLLSRPESAIVKPMSVKPMGQPGEQNQNGSDKEHASGAIQRSAEGEVILDLVSYPAD